MLKCEECSFNFDERDKRAFIHSDGKSHSCPACKIMGFGSIEAWAVSNDCQGVFTDSISSSRKAAEYELQKFGGRNAGACVVPVRVIAEPKDKHHFRNWCEDQNK